MTAAAVAEYGADIRVIGVGGAGGNAVQRMLATSVPGIAFAVVNTDQQALATAAAAQRCLIGTALTGGLGAGGDPAVGEGAAEASERELRAQVAGADLVFVAAGMGGGTGSGAAPLVARYAKEAGALTIAVVTRPFAFEGARRQRVAAAGIARLVERADACIIIPNERLLTVAERRLSVPAAFALADEVLRQGIQGIADIIMVPGLINVDFADVKAVMQDAAGTALLAIGSGTGPTRATDAVRQALASPLLDFSLAGARGVLLNVTGGADLTLFEVTAAAELVHAAVDPAANIILGAVPNGRDDGVVTITVIATGFRAPAGAASPV